MRALPSSDSPRLSTSPSPVTEFSWSLSDRERAPTPLTFSSLTKSPPALGLAMKTQEYIARRTEIDYATYVRYRGKLQMK